MLKAVRRAATNCPTVLQNTAWCVQHLQQYTVIMVLSAVILVGKNWFQISTTILQQTLYQEFFFFKTKPIPITSYVISSTYFIHFYHYRYNLIFRAFFRRGITRAYVCVSEHNKCTVDNVTRSNCKKCRFEK